MNVVPLLVFCSLGLALVGVLLFVFSTRNRDHDHFDRLSLLPMDDELTRQPTDSPSPENHD